MRKAFAKMDKLLLVSLIVFAIFGLIMIYSASSVSAVLRYKVSPSYFFLRQLVFLICGLIAGIVILKVPTSKYKIIAPFALIGIIVALVGLFTYGKITNNAQSWYNLGPINIQPTEFAKSILILFMAVFYSGLVRARRPKKLASLIPLAFGLVIAVLVMMQPDLGGAAIILFITFFIFLGVPIQKENKKLIIRIVIGGALVGGLALLFMGKSIMNSMQMSRFNFTSPCSRYTEDTGYQVCNGFIAIHNGGLWGVGLGNSTQKYLYLPEAHTDFIFPIICEEFGLFGGILVILGYVFMLWRILKIAKEAETVRGSILAYGTFLYLLAHILINILGVLALVPLTGVPLPLLSYGGSFTINVVIMIFVVLRVSIENKTIKAERELKNI